MPRLNSITTTVNLEGQQRCHVCPAPVVAAGAFFSLLTPGIQRILTAQAATEASLWYRTETSRTQLKADHLLAAAQTGLVPTKLVSSLA